MKKHFLSLAISAALWSGTSTTFAEEYNTFVDLNIAQAEIGSNFEIDSTSFGVKYFFEAQESLGPLAEFEYINTKNVIAFNYDNAESSFFGSSFDTETVQFSGEYHINGFVVGASYANLDSDTVAEDDSISALYLGYFINENFKVFVNSTTDKFENVLNENKAYYTFGGSYVKALTGNDYVGFTYTTNEEWNSHNLSSKYFTDLGGDRYLTVEGSIVKEKDVDANFNLEGKYYFTRETNILVGLLNDADTIKVGAQHYFNKNLSVALAYEDDDDYEAWSLGLSWDI